MLFKSMRILLAFLTVSLSLEIYASTINQVITGVYSPIVSAGPTITTDSVSWSSSVEFGKFAPSNGKLNSVTVNVSLLPYNDLEGLWNPSNNAEYVDYGAEQTLSFYVLGGLPSSVAHLLQDSKTNSTNQSLTLDPLESGYFGEKPQPIISYNHVFTGMDVIAFTGLDTFEIGYGMDATIYVDGNGVVNMIQDFSIGLSMNVEYDYITLVPVPSAVWLFGSGLVGLIGIARRRA